MPSTPSTDPRPLPEIEHELDALLVRYANLEAARLKMKDVLGRVHAELELEAVIARMGELQAAIAAAPAKGIVDVAVKLRRLAACLSLGGVRVRTFKPGLYEHQLLASALAAVEAVIVTAPGK